MEIKLRDLYIRSQKFFQENFLSDRKIWFGVKDIKVNEKEVAKIFSDYEKDTFLDFCKRIKDVIYAKNPLVDVQKKWSTDSWTSFYYFDFLRKEKIVDFNRNNGKIRVLKRELFDLLPKPRTEKEVQTLIERKLKKKIAENLPVNLPFGTKIKSRYDQFPVSFSSAVFIVSKILEYLPLYEKFLFIGDDDLISVYLSLADDKIKSLVVDIDDDLLNNIKKIAQKFNLKIETKKIDVSKVKKLPEKFVGFHTNPVYTFEGAKIFLDFGVKNLGLDGGFGFFVFSDEGIGNRYLLLQEFITEKKLKVEELIRGKIYYPWQIIHSEDKIMEERYKEIFSEDLIFNSPIISSSLWVFNYIPFKVPKPKKQPFYAYL